MLYRTWENFGGGNFGEFGEWRAIRQNFPCQIFINTTKYLNRIIITMAGMLKYVKPKQRHEENDDEEKSKVTNITDLSKTFQVFACLFSPTQYKTKNSGLATRD